MIDSLAIAVTRFAKHFGNVDWNNGNCYYFAVICKSRFGGDIYYDTIAGHFVVKILDRFYDSTGIYEPVQQDCIISWQSFKQYDISQYNRIVRDCINI